MVAENPVGGEEAPVADQVAREVAIAVLHLVPRREDLADPVVALPLVHEPLATAIDDQRPRQAALQGEELTDGPTVDLEPGKVGHHAPPRFVHPGEVGADRHAHPMTVADVVRRPAPCLDRA